MPVKARMTLAGGLRAAGLCVLGAIALAGFARAEPVTIVALGDSLTAGFGLAPGEAFPEQLEAALRRKGYDVSIANAGVSGDTSSGGLARLEWSVPADADAVIVELGANDALRGIDPDVTRSSLTEILDRLRARGQPVLLAGMRAPLNMGPDYGAAFDGIFDDLGKAEDVVFYPFFLDGVAANPALNQADGIHPNAEGVRVIVEGMLPTTEELIQIVTATR